MRTLAAGTRVLGRSPTAIFPMALESLLVALLMAFGALPRTGVSVTAAGVFPLGVYFDLKQALSHAPGWPFFIAALIVSLLVRSAVISSTLWLADGKRGPLAPVWLRAGREAAIALAAFIPSAALFFAGVAIRYAPFLWLAAPLGLVAAIVVARRGLTMDAGAGRPRGSGLPEIPAFLAYAYLLGALAAVMSVLGSVSFLLPAFLIACTGPLQALFVLGWREHMRAETYPGGGTLAALATVVAVAGLAGATVYDRYVANPPPVGEVEARGTLFILGGADSTSETGALAHVDPRDFGFGRERTERLSYSALGRGYVASDTRRDLDVVADIVAEQMGGFDPPRYVLGHSQAALILDRLLDKGLVAPDRSVVISGPPPRPPTLDVPGDGGTGDGAVGADVARGLAALLRSIGLQGFDIDAPSAPTNLEPVIAADDSISRLSVWALADSVWLDGDWRRPGELNVVALTDHVGATNDARTLTAARTFLTGGSVPGDETGWRGFLVAALRYAFEPWRPG